MLTLSNFLAWLLMNCAGPLSDYILYRCPSRLLLFEDKCEQDTTTLSWMLSTEWKPSKCLSDLELLPWRWSCWRHSINYPLWTEMVMLTESTQRHHSVTSHFGGRDGTSVMGAKKKSHLTVICLSCNVTFPLLNSNSRLFWCQNKWHCDHDKSWQAVCHVYSAVTRTSKCPCQISPKPLIMSLFFNFTAPGSSILFSIRCIIFEVADSPVTVSKWCLTSSTGSFVKSLAFGQMLLSVPGRRGSKQWCGSHAYVTPAPALALAMKSLDCSRISEMEPLWMLA